MFLFEVPNSNPDWDTGYHDWGFLFFFPLGPFWQIRGHCFVIDHCRFLRHPFKSIGHFRRCIVWDPDELPNDGTPWSGFLFEKLVVLQPVKFSVFYGIHCFIAVLRRACHLSLSWARTTMPASYLSKILFNIILALAPRYCSWCLFRQVPQLNPCMCLSSPQYLPHSPRIRNTAS